MYKIKNNHTIIIAIIIALLLFMIPLIGIVYASLIIVSPYNIETITYHTSPQHEPINIEKKSVEDQIQYPNHWTCYDYAVNYSEQHPDFGIVVISNNPTFQGYPNPVTGEGNNHFVNYKILQNKDLLIHDESNGRHEYTVRGWEDDDLTFEYYHFYINGEVPTRTWKYLLPNAEVTYSEI